MTTPGHSCLRTALTSRDHRPYLVARACPEYVVGPPLGWEASAGASPVPGIVMHHRPVPTLTTAAGAVRLARFALPHLFFNDVATGRGVLLYRRYDGGIGEVRPVR